MSIKFEEGPLDERNGVFAHYPVPVYYVKPGEIPSGEVRKAVPAEALVRMPSGKTIGPIGGECLRSALANGGVVVEETKPAEVEDKGPRIHVF